MIRLKLLGGPLDGQTWTDIDHAPEFGEVLTVNREPYQVIGQWTDHEKNVRWVTARHHVTPVQPVSLTDLVLAAFTGSSIGLLFGLGLLLLMAVGWALEVLSSTVGGILNLILLLAGIGAVGGFLLVFARPEVIK